MEIRWLGSELEKSGREFTWIGKLPRGFARMKQQACFSNAQQLVLQRSGLRYVEGEAWKDGMIMPVHHAWVIDENDQVIDTTWTNRAQAPRTYRGAVVVDRDDLVKHFLARPKNFFYPFMCCMSDWCWCINLLDYDEEEETEVIPDAEADAGSSRLRSSTVQGADRLGDGSGPGIPSD